MKHIKTWLFLAGALGASAFAGEIKDGANIFRDEAGHLSKALARANIWMETRMTTPTEGLKTYADAKARQVAPRSFYVVITMQPREWHISMNPEGLVSPERVRRAGDAMAASFREGRMDLGASELIMDLLDLLLVDIVREHFTAEMGKARLPEETKAEAKQGVVTDYTSVWVLGGIFAFTFGVIFWAWRRVRAKERKVAIASANY